MVENRECNPIYMVLKSMTNKHSFVLLKINSSFD